MDGESFDLSKSDGTKARVVSKSEEIAERQAKAKELREEGKTQQEIAEVLVLCNTQSELHPLEEGKHAAESGMDLKAYAERAGKVRTTLTDKVKAFRVLSVTHMRHEDVCKDWRNLAEIHAAPKWLWSALTYFCRKDKDCVRALEEQRGELGWGP